MKAPRILLSLLFSSLLLQAQRTDSYRPQATSYGALEFIRQDMGSIWEVMRPITGAGKPETVPLWQELTLPHCFNAEDAVDPDVNYYQGPGWYRTMLNIENPNTNWTHLPGSLKARDRRQRYMSIPPELLRTWVVTTSGRQTSPKPWKHSVARRSAGAFRRKDSYCHSLRQQPRHGAYSFRYVRLQPLRRTLPICQPRLYACRPF